LGEVWKLNSCPHNPRLLASVYNVQKGAQVLTQSALLTLPEDLNPDPEHLKSEYLPWEQVEILDTEALGERVKTIEFHPRTVLKLHYQYIHISLICGEERNENKNHIFRLSIDNYIRNARGSLPRKYQH